MHKKFPPQRCRASWGVEREINATARWEVRGRAKEKAFQWEWRTFGGLL